MSGKTEACWDRTEGCCMTDAFKRGMRRPKRAWGDAPAHLFKTPAGCWHWTCRGQHPSEPRRCQPTFFEALEALNAHLCGPAVKEVGPIATDRPAP